jgi:hypothetical protein
MMIGGGFVGQIGVDIWNALKPSFFELFKFLESDIIPIMPRFFPFFVGMTITFICLRIRSYVKRKRLAKIKTIPETHEHKDNMIQVEVVNGNILYRENRTYNSGQRLEMNAEEFNRLVKFGQVKRV